MAATDVEQRLAEAVVAILTADSGVQTLAGRTTGLVVPQDGIAPAALPCLAYTLAATQEIGGTGDNRRVQLQLVAVAEGAGADSVCRHLMERCEQALSWAAFQAQGLDAAILRRRRWPGPPVDGEGTRRLARAALEAEVWVTT